MVWSMTVFEALAYPFMQRALAAGVLVGVMTSLLGVLVVLRRSAFFAYAPCSRTSQFARRFARTFALSAPRTRI